MAKDRHHTFPPDPFELTDASIDELAFALSSAVDLPADDEIAPLTEQIAGLIMARAIHIIRTASRAVTTEASATLALLVVSETGETLERIDEEAYSILSSASLALSAASPASSKGGALMMARSWNGLALKVVELVAGAPDQEMFRSELRAKLDVGDSHLSHLLSDLEGARLIVRVRDGRQMRVLLGPEADSEEFRRFTGLDVHTIIGPGSRELEVSSGKEVPTNRIEPGSLVLSGMPDLLGHSAIGNEPLSPTATMVKSISLNVGDEEGQRPETGPRRSARHLRPAA